MTTDVVILDDPPKAKRGTSNANARGSVYARRARRAWMMIVWACDVRGFVRCYRCGCLLFNPDTIGPETYVQPESALPLTIDRIIPGCKGGTYRRNNIRPACGHCNSETGGALATTGRKTK